MIPANVGYDFPGFSYRSPLHPCAQSHKYTPHSAISLPIADRLCSDRPREMLPLAPSTHSFADISPLTHQPQRNNRTNPVMTIATCSLLCQLGYVMRHQRTSDPSGDCETHCRSTAQPFNRSTFNCSADCCKLLQTACSSGSSHSLASQRTGPSPLHVLPVMANHDGCFPH